MKSLIETFYLDRPERANAFDVETAKSLAKHADSLVKKHGLGLIIASRSSKIFCGGGDLRSYAKMKTKDQGVAVNAGIRGVLEVLSFVPLFVIAAIEGETVGGGCELALNCDYIIAGNAAGFLFKQVHQGLTPGWGGMKKLLNRVKPSTALDWLSSGRRVDAAEALRTGLVDEVVPTGDTEAAARRWLEMRATHSPEYISRLKSLISQKGEGEEKVFDSLWFSAEHRKVLDAAKK